MRLFDNAIAANPVSDGDRFRDAGKWRQAAECYAKHLEYNPSDVAILVQAGNCLKEAGDYLEAKKRYAAALQIDPDNSDTHLQYGHLMKLMGRRIDAMESYRRSTELDPRNQDALLELLAAGPAGETFGPSHLDDSVNTIWLDVTDLMEYTKNNKSLSGIQRVVSNLILHIEAVVVTGYRLIPVIPEYDRHRILAVKLDNLTILVRQFDVPITDRRMIDKVIESVYETRVEVWPGRDDIFVVAGAFWIYQHYDVVRAFRKKGMRFGVFIHDLIQIKNPEYVAKDANDRFQKQLVDVLSVSDFVIANSVFVASEVQSYLKDHLNLAIPVRTVLLPTELRKSKVRKSVLSESIRAMGQANFVLCAATIEVRKNHMYQVRVWERLSQEFGEKLPWLVWVGKWGWQIDELRKYVNERGYIDDWLFIFNDISDDELEYLYKRCLFTIYTSYAEGFGLPIGESLAYGKPCIASNVTSMPEVGGRFARYIDPWNPSQGYKVVRDAILDREGLAAWADDIKANFQPKTWADFCGEFFSTAISMSQRLSDGPGLLNCFLPKGRIIEGGDDALFRLAARGQPLITFRAARDSGWFNMEHWGVWASQRRSSLVFDSELGPGERVIIYLEVQCPAESGDIVLRAEAGAGPADFDVSEQKSFIAFAGMVGESGRIKIELLARGPFGGQGEQPRYIGLTAMAYCEGADALARIDLLEKVSLYSRRAVARRSDRPVLPAVS